ncbi:PIG-P-domain-containing protein [Entophlyctis helioformis]|nr:PIG-P-domain-containing protein [Entophlyctis helioformis]
MATTLERTLSKGSMGGSNADLSNSRTPSTTREYYGFVLYLSSIVAFIVYIIWAVFPDKGLRSIGITYYPSRQWALVIPIWILGLIPFTIAMFTAINLLNTPPFDSFLTLTDEHARLLNLTTTNIERILDRDLIPDLEDVPITLVNKCLSHDLPRGAWGDTESPTTPPMTPPMLSPRPSRRPRLARAGELVSDGIPEEDEASGNMSSANSARHAATHPEIPYTAYSMSSPRPGAGSGLASTAATVPPFDDIPRGRPRQRSGSIIEL